MPSRVYDPNARVMTQAEVDAFFAAKREAKAARVARRARLDRERAERGPPPSATLAALAVGASHTFHQYQSTTQVSSLMRSAFMKCGGRYTSRLARDLLTGDTVIGVTVTRTE